MSKKKFTHTSERLISRASEHVVPILMDWFHSKSVVDVGCGLGNWLSTFERQGVTDYLGIDGHHVNRELLAIPGEKILLTNLEEPIPVERKFDLAMSLEVAEHLSESAADTFVRSLTSLSDIIVFSAAVPFQGGQNHINEQPVTYWIEKFDKRGYTFYDPIRELIWNNPQVDAWYKQNMFLIIKNGVDHPFQKSRIFPYIHPDMFEIHARILTRLLEGKAGVLLPLKMLAKALIRPFDI